MVKGIGNQWFSSQEDKSWEKEANIWAEFYTTFNDDNASHMYHAFQNNSLWDKTAEELKEKNINWIRDLLERGVDEEEIIAIMPEAREYLKIVIE